MTHRRVPADTNPRIVHSIDSEDYLLFFRALFINVPIGVGMWVGAIACSLAFWNWLGR